MKTKLSEAVSKLLVLFLFFVSCLTLSSCGEEPDPYVPPVPSYNQAYSYFPSEDNYSWLYSETTFDTYGIETYANTQTRVYDKTKKRLVHTSNGQLRGYSNWYNNGSKLQCCEGRSLIDYQKLNCNGDSVLIREDNIKQGSYNIFTRTYQFCNTESIDIDGYENRVCIKTLQIEKTDEGYTFFVERYFGKGIGLIYQKVVSYDINNLVERTEILKLISHEF